MQGWKLLSVGEKGVQQWVDKKELVPQKVGQDRQVDG